MTHTDTTALSEALADRPVWPAMKRGWRQQCPCCGRGTLFSSYLKLRSTCPICDEDLSYARADDGPAYLSILITAKVMGTLMLWTYTAFLMDPWLLAAIFCVGSTAMALYLLPRLKGMIVGIQWAKRMHGF